ncbi:toll/interleukin-1 receptor domain-containing protein [Saccharopolyspora indica]|uniref:toll/interleukin-1 receptor domain-containing protein n=1 Tax=Saccharopolyspora indica TaxID=1229659 RepID=UPI0022EB58D2|nr:toll/interleukin-1 receptor domain-containing protein [Saccharopolyspora indica]MDA3648441.1 toll/interleukin-1 receptor domain-containing protein [Saccharopolyspora indica]
MFCNYRVDDSGQAVVASLIADTLSKQLGKGQIFFASREIRLGEYFDEAIRDALRDCAVLIAVIGREWLTAAGADGRRLDDPDDWVRREIAYALGNGKRVIPILIDNTPQLNSSDLPDDIADLARCQFRRITYKGAVQEIDRLITELVATVPELAAIQLPGTEELSEWWASWSAGTEPAMPPGVLLAGREQEVADIESALHGPPSATFVKSDSQSQAIAFIGAFCEAREDPLARAVVVSDQEAWRYCIEIPQSRLLVPTFDAPGVARAVQRGHHVLVPAGPNQPTEGTVVVLPGISMEGARRAFEDSGVPAPQARVFAAEARRNLPGLRRSLSRDEPEKPDLPGQPVGTAGSELAHAVSRGPLRHLGLDAERARADQLRETDPLQAADRYGAIAAKLRASGFAVHSGPFQVEQAKALRAAGKHDEAALTAMELLWSEFREGSEHVPIEPVIGELHGNDVMSPEVRRVASFLLNVPDVASGYDCVERSLAPTFDTLTDDDPHRLDAAVCLAEQAMSTRNQHVVANRAEELSVLSGEIAEPGSPHEQSAVRLAMCVAEVTGEWESLLQRARREFAPYCRPWILARRARWYFLANRIHEAEHDYSAAIEDALIESMNEEAADWLYALRMLRMKQGPLFPEGDTQHPFAQHLRGESRPSRLPGNALIDKQALRSLLANKPRQAVSRLSRWRWRSYVRANLLSEMEATRELGKAMAANQEPLAGLQHLVWSESRKQAIEAAKSLPEESIDWPVEAMGTTAGQVATAFAATSVCADLVSDEAASGWVDAALATMRGKGPAGVFPDEPVFHAIKALTALGPVLTEAQARTALDILGPLVPAPGRSYRTDHDHAELLVHIAADHQELSERAAKQLVDGLLGSDDFLRTALRNQDSPLLSDCITELEDRFVMHASEGNRRACLVLARFGRPTDAVRSLAIKGAKQVINRPAATPTQVTYWGPYYELLNLAHLLPSAVRNELADAMLRHALDLDDDMMNRLDALDGLAGIAADLDVDHRRRIFDALDPIAHEDHPHAQGNAMHQASRHPLSFFRTKFGTETTADGAVLARAWLAVTETDRSSVQTQAIHLLRSSTEVRIPVVVRALRRIGLSSLTTPPQFFAAHPHPHVQALAASLWAADPADAEHGLFLAKSPHRLVRTVLAKALVERPEHRAVRDFLATDARRSIRSLVTGRS